MTDAQLYFAIKNLPPDLKTEVAEFIESLRLKNRPQLEKRRLGCAEGLIELAPDFDKPLEDFKNYI